MELFDNLTVPVTCPSCGEGGHAIFGQTIAGGKLRWYRSISCPTSGSTEEDGVGGGPIDLRTELLRSKGTWSVRIIGAGKAKSVKTAKQLFSLSNDDASFLLQSYPSLQIGTKAEADWLVQKLASEGVTGQTESPNGNDS
jgi:hypothetical protein